MVLRTELLLYHIFFYYIRHAKIVKFIIIQKSLDLCCYNCCDMKRINLDQEQSCLWRHKIIISKKNKNKTEAKFQTFLSFHFEFFYIMYSQFYMRLFYLLFQLFFTFSIRYHCYPSYIAPAQALPSLIQTNAWVAHLTLINLIVV